MEIFDELWHLPEFLNRTAVISFKIGVKDLV